MNFSVSRTKSPVLTIAGAIVALAAGILPTAPADAASACWDEAPTDLDGGGPDIAIGYPSYDLPGATDAGAIVIYSNAGVRGSSTPRTPTARTVYTAASFGIPVQQGARFGASVFAVPDGAFFTDHDECADLIVGAPGTTAGTMVDAGRVYVLGGNAGGLQREVIDTIDAGSLGVVDGVEAGGRFGSAIAVTGGVIAIGEPGRDIDGAVDAGRVVRIDHQVVGPEPVITAATQGTGAETGDRFGEVLDAFGTWQGGVVLVGVPHEDVGSRKDAGAVALIAPDGTVSLATQNSRGMAGSAEAGDQLGASLDAFATFETHPVIRVAVGAPGEDTTVGNNAGIVGWAAVDLLDSPDRIPPIRGTAVTISQDSRGVPGTAEAGDRFGASVATGEIGTDSGRRLVVGSPSEDVGSIPDAGMAGISRVSEAGAPLATGSASWTQNSTGVSDAAERGDNAGAVLSAVSLTSVVDDEDVVWQSVVITVPRENRGQTVDAGRAYVSIPGQTSVVLLPPFTQSSAGIGMAPMRTEW
jgi:hypothetical protein